MQQPPKHGVSGRRAMLYGAAMQRERLPPAWASPLVALLLILPPLIGTLLTLDSLGWLDAEDNPRDAWALCAMLFLPFSAMGLLTLAWVRWGERRPRTTIGLAAPGAARRWACGAVAGLLMAAAVVAGIWLAGGYAPGTRTGPLAAPAALLAIGALFAGFAVQSGVEELVFRGWLMSAVGRRWRPAGGVAISSLLFALLHFSAGQSPLADFNLILFGLFCASWALAADEIWGVMGWHAAWNWLLATGFQVPITGLGPHTPALLFPLAPRGPDFLTGGPQGPEGSVICTLVFALGIVAASWRIHRRRMRAPAPSTS